MKQFMKVAVLPAVAAFFITACGSTGSSRETPTEDTTVALPAAPVSAIGIKLKDDKLNAVYQQYTQLTSALVKGDVKEARLAGNAIAAGAADMKDGAGLTASAAKIAATADVEGQRTVFSQLSNDLISLVKQSGVQSGELYVDFCPMAMEDKGAFWLSSSKAIQNPYFGDAMMTCGEVKETIQ